MIKSWSFSRLSVYEQCPHRAYLAYVVKAPEPPRVIPEGLDEHPLDRGLRIHEAAEHFVTRNIELIDALEPLREDLETARRIFQDDPARCLVEHQWAVDSSWHFVAWENPDAWLRAVADLLIFEDDRLRIIDHKTGKKYPVKHIQQGQLYAVIAALKYPQYEKFTIEFWYPDQGGDKLERTYSKMQCQMFKDDFERRGLEMTTAECFDVKASPYNCKWCPFNKTEAGSGACDFAYDYDQQR